MVAAGSRTGDGLPRQRPADRCSAAGSFAAVTDQVGQGTRIRYQDVVLEPGQIDMLSLYVYDKSNSPIVCSATDSLITSSCRISNTAST